MTDLSSLRARLRQKKHSAEAKPPVRTVTPPPWDGQVRGGERGEYFLIEQSIPRAHAHGGRPLDDFLARDLEPHWAPELPGRADLPRAVFFDTETTGLAGGTGTIAFLVGVGFFQEDAFQLRQYFLHDPAGEAQLLADVLDALTAGSMLITFNGRHFDVPLLQARATLRLRRMRVLEGLPHLDLLPHARRMWRGRVESCALSALEHSVLGVQRLAEDVPGWEIPGLYRDYLLTGESRPLERVLYHNAQDILSMVALAAELTALYTLPPEEMADGGNALALAVQMHRRGEPVRAEELYHAAARLRGAHEPAAFEGLARLLKQQRRISEAVPFWEAWCRSDPHALVPRLELAKFFEWTARDYAAALRWTDEAESACASSGSQARERREMAALRKRSERLHRKQRA